MVHLLADLNVITRAIREAHVRSLMEEVAGWHAHVFVGMWCGPTLGGHAHEDVGMPPMK
jgi:hypothetical protein